MASKKRKQKIANAGGYNWSHKNVHLARKEAKIHLKKMTGEDELMQILLEHLVEVNISLVELRQRVDAAIDRMEAMDQ